MQNLPAREVLLNAGLEDGQGAWHTSGDADFSLDADQRFEGKKSLRVTIRPAVEPHWQQWQYDIQGVNPGDALQASVQVRTRDVTESTGAYFCLEYLDAQGQRCGIDHSPISLETGKNDWTKLEIFGHAAPGVKTLRVGLILNSRGTAWFSDAQVLRTEKARPWPDLGDAERKITVHTNEVIQPHFGGAGYHDFHHVHPVTETMFDEVVGKRWREVAPSFVRMNHDYGWDEAQLDKVARQMLFFQKETNTEIYLTTWNPPDCNTPEEFAAYARHMVDHLEYFVRKRGITNVHYFCMSNELSLAGWGKLNSDLPKFREYHRALYAELQRRKLDIKLLATDASPIGYWNSIEWAAKNMDDITGIYGGHHYINDYALEDEQFYPWFLERLQWGVGLARARGKEFVLGEFGAKQDGRVIDGVRQDRCIYWDTPQEALVPIQVCEASMAAMNAGVCALGYWTFMDFPDNPGSGYANKWGLFKWSGSDYSARSVYYSYGLFTKLFRGPATVYKVETNDPRLRVTAVQHNGRGTWAIAVVNRNPRPVHVGLSLEGKPTRALFRKYVYDPAHVPASRFADLQAPSSTLAMAEGRLSDTVPAGSIAFYTTAYDTTPPAPVRGLKVQAGADGKRALEWRASTEPDLCYYRVYRSTSAAAIVKPENQIASTIATHYLDETAAGGKTFHYRVVAVDRSGNAGEK